MDDKISTIAFQMSVLERELRAVLSKNKAELSIEQNFDQKALDDECLKHYQNNQKSLWTYIRHSDPRVALTVSSPLSLGQFGVEFPGPVGAIIALPVTNDESSDARNNAT